MVSGIEILLNQLLGSLIKPRHTGLDVMTLHEDRPLRNPSSPLPSHTITFWPLRCTPTFRLGATLCRDVLRCCHTIATPEPRYCPVLTRLTSDWASSTGRFRSTPASINRDRPPPLRPPPRPHRPPTTPAPLPHRPPAIQALISRLLSRVWQVFERFNAGYLLNQYVVHLYASVTA